MLRMLSRPATVCGTDSPEQGRESMAPSAPIRPLSCFATLPVPLDRSSGICEKPPPGARTVPAYQRRFRVAGFEWAVVHGVAKRNTTRVRISLAGSVRAARQPVMAGSRVHSGSARPDRGLLVRPTGQDREIREFRHQLTRIRQLLDRFHDDLDSLQADAERCAAAAERYPLCAGEAHFLLGSVYLRRGERSGPTATDFYQQACAVLEQAEVLGVPESDQMRLLYRLGKASFHAGRYPRRVLEYLLAAGEQGAEDRAEALVLLTQSYLRLPSPDLPGALESNDKLLNLANLRTELLGPARLLRAELLMSMGDADPARSALESILATTPPPTPQILESARQLLVRSYQAQERWADAAELWKQLAEHADSPRELSHLLCYLGACHAPIELAGRRGTNLGAAAPENAGDEEEQAAALGLAELRMSKSPEKAVEAFERVVRHVQSPADWKNTLVDLAKVRERFEWGCVCCQQPGKFELAMRLATLSEGVALPGKATLLHAQTLEKWAQTRDLRAHQALKPEASRQEEAGARELFCQAGTSYEAAASDCAPQERGERLWHGVTCYLQGQDTRSVRRLLQQLDLLERFQEKVGEGWFRLAEVHRLLKEGQSVVEAGDHEQSALEALAECKKHPGKFAYRCASCWQRKRSTRATSTAPRPICWRTCTSAPSRWTARLTNRPSSRLADILFRRAMRTEDERLGRLSPGRVAPGSCARTVQGQSAGHRAR